jgi:hypothetical protein
MTFLKNATVALAAVSMVAAPAAASAANFDGLRADTEVTGAALGETAGESWILLLLAAAAIVAGIIIAADGSDDSPTSP